MFLDCSSKRIHVPTTTESNIVFPFAPLQIKFEVNKKDLEHAKPRLQEADIMSGLNKIEQTCNKFAELKQYRLSFFFSLGFSWFLALIVLLLVNKGTRSSSGDINTDLIKLTNGYFISAFALSAVAFFQNGIIACILAIKAKNARIMYEEKLFPLIGEINEELKALEIRWKVGKSLRWVEISLDYKKKDTMKLRNPDEVAINIESQP